MPMNLERSPRDIAGGYLLLMLSRGESGSNKLPNPTWDCCDNRIRQHPQLGLYLADSVPSLYSKEQHDLKPRYWNLAMDKGGCLFSYALSRDDPGYPPIDQARKVALENAAIHQSRLLHSLPAKTNEEKKSICSPSPPVSPLSESIPTPSSNNDTKVDHLPLWFANSKTTVVIGKGHLPRKTPGNHLLRQLVRDRLQAYKESNRRGRAVIVSDIYKTIQSRNPDGRYFGNFSRAGKWEEAKEHSARDKIAATFRDSLSDLYKSSTKSKVAKRRKRKEETRKNGA